MDLERIHGRDQYYLNVLYEIPKENIFFKNRTSVRKNMIWGLRMENYQNKILGWAKLIRSNILHMGKVWFRETSNLYKVTEFIGHRQSHDPTPAFQSSAL